MSTGYVRQSSALIVTGATILASHFNNEYNAIEAAFDKTTGHAHDGTTGGGAPLLPPALSGLSSNGVVVRVSASAFAARTLTGTTNQITITNGTGVSGNPTFSLPTSLTNSTNSTITDKNVILGGSGSSITTGSDSVILGGITHTISSNSVYNAIIGGNTGTISAGARQAIIGGITNTISSSGVNNVIIGGSSNTISGSSASGLVSGAENTVSSDFGIATGYRSVNNKYAGITHAAGYFATAGDAQFGNYIARRVTSNGAQQTLLLNGANSTNLLTIPSDTTWFFRVHIAARRTDADNESAAYEITGCIDNNAGTTALVGTITKTVTAEDTAAWDVTAEADDTNDCLLIKVTGEAAKTINWVAHVMTVEVTG